MSELKELIYNLLADYKGAESAEIWERSGSMDSDIKEMESYIATCKEKADKLLDSVNGRLTGAIMSETTDALNGAIIQKIELREGEEASNFDNGYCTYELLVITNRGTLRFAGEHDLTGDLEIIARPFDTT